jgi:hypothetical protein
VAADLTAPTEWVRMDRIEGWRRSGATVGKRPAIFLLQAPPVAPRRPQRS